MSHFTSNVPFSENVSELFNYLRHQIDRRIDRSTVHHLWSLFPKRASNGVEFDCSITHSQRDDIVCTVRSRSVCVCLFLCRKERERRGWGERKSDKVHYKRGAEVAARKSHAIFPALNPVLSIRRKFPDIWSTARVLSVWESIRLCCSIFTIFFLPPPKPSPKSWRIVQCSWSIRRG